MHKNYILTIKPKETHYSFDDDMSINIAFNEEFTVATIVPTPKSFVSNEYPHLSPSEKSLPKGNEDRLTEVKELCRREHVGVVPDHLVELQILAKEKNCIIGIRPVDEMATDLIEKGHPTKGFHIKGKSANWGPQTAFICVKQELSKLADQPQRLGKFNEQVESCLTEGYAQKIPLEITRERLNLLIEKSVINNVKYNAQRQPIELESKTPEGVNHKFTLVHSDKEPGVYQVRHDGVPIEVLAPPGQNKKPLTADYDLLMIAPSIEDFGAQDMLPLHDVSHDVFKARINKYKTRPENLADPLKKAYANPATFYKPQDKEIGNVSSRIRDMIPEINKRLVGTGEPVVHHGSDTASPATDMEANFPAAFTLPKPLGQFDEICVIKDFEELKALVLAAKNEGYHVPLNPLWEKNITDIRSESFTEAKKNIATNFSRFLR